MKRWNVLIVLICVLLMLACCGKAAEGTDTALEKTEERIVLHEDGTHTFTDGVCTVCGYVDMSALSEQQATETYGYYHLDRDGSHTVNTGDRILFGSFPQTVCKDEQKTARLTELLTDAWQDYGYFADGERKSLMSYQDMILEDEMYRAVRIDSSRPYYIDLAATEENSYSAQNGYTAGSVSYFLFEPVEWRVLDYANGEALLCAEKCLDGQSYSGAYDVKKPMYYNKGTEIFLNDWEHSLVRSYLNGSFYNSAFSEQEKSLLVTKTLDNRNSGFDPESTFTKSQNSTQDMVFLLSYQDILNPLYGFADVKGNANGSVSVMKTGTDYALCQGLRTSAQSANENGEPCSWWMLRSAGGKSFSVCGLTKTGELTNSKTAEFTTSASDGLCTYTAEGIVPAVVIKIGK